MKYFMLLVAAAGVMSACETDLEKIQTLPDSEVKAPVIHELAENEVSINPTNRTSKFVVEWDAADFGKGIMFTTDIYLSYNDTEVAVATGLSKDKTSYTLTYQQMNTLASKAVDKGGLGVPIDTTVDVKLRVGSVVGTTGKMLYSEYAVIKFTYTNKREEAKQPEDGDTTEGDENTEGDNGGENTEGDNGGENTEGDGTTETPEGDDTTTDDTTTEGDDAEGGEDSTDGDTPVENN